MSWYLIHSAAGSMRAGHKYIGRISLGQGKYKYFYTQEEYDAYKRGLEKKSAKPTTATTVSTKSSKGSGGKKGGSGKKGSGKKGKSSGSSKSKVASIVEKFSSSHVTASGSLSKNSQESHYSKAGQIDRKATDFNPMQPSQGIRKEVEEPTPTTERIPTLKEKKQSKIKKIQQDRAARKKQQERIVKMRIASRR